MQSEHTRTGLALLVYGKSFVKVSPRCGHGGRSSYPYPERASVCRTDASKEVPGAEVAGVENGAVEWLENLERPRSSNKLGPSTHSPDAVRALFDDCMRRVQMSPDRLEKVVIASPDNYDRVISVISPGVA
jgi:hypothetical protein